jgi:NADH:ubiquinone oxidoreductase subunit 6 (subunit J)
MKVVSVLFLVAVVGALGAAGVQMLRKDRSDDPQGRRMARALALRVGLSIAVFLLVLLGYWMGWIKPNGIPLGG